MRDPVSRASSLTAELKAVLTGLHHVRHALEDGRLEALDDLWPRLERCTHEIVKLSPDERDGMRPILLTLSDELQRTMAAMGREYDHIGEKLRSASRGKAVNAAYRQARRS